MADNSYLDTPIANLLDLAPAVLKDKQTFVDMLDVFGQVLEQNVENPIQQLEDVRFITQETDDNILRYTARLLGFDLTQDVLNLSQDNLTKIVTQLALYPDQNGTELFTKFIDLVLNSVTEVRYLYTRDYVNFYDTPRGLLNTDGGEWFKTTHIALTLALISLETLVLKPGETLRNRALELFYTFAPVALVIEHLEFSLIFNDADWLGGKAFGLDTALLEYEVQLEMELE